MLIRAMEKNTGVQRGTGKSYCCHSIWGGQEMQQWHWTKACGKWERKPSRHWDEEHSRLKEQHMQRPWGRRLLCLVQDQQWGQAPGVVWTGKAVEKVWGWGWTFITFISYCKDFSFVLKEIALEGPEQRNDMVWLKRSPIGERAGQGHGVCCFVRKMCFTSVSSGSGPGAHCVMLTQGNLPSRSKLAAFAQTLSRWNSKHQKELFKLNS